ncbi:MAG: lipopolysaccharide assembly protein LapA domain-containing protein [Bacteroidota bacterium]
MSRSAIISIISAILLVIFAIQNSGTALLTLFFWKFEMSLALMLLLLFVLGAGFGYFFHIAVALRKKAEIMKKTEAEN